MRGRNSFFFIFVLLQFFLVVSCNGNQIEDPVIPDEEHTTLVVDSFGREVQVPKKIERIAALYSFAGYAVCLLERGNDLVAVPGGLQRDVLLREMYPNIFDASVPRAGGTINIEELLRIKPDLVIIRGDTAVDEKEKEKLDNTGLPYIVVEFSTIEEQQQAISIIGEAIGKTAEAKNYNDYYNHTIDRVAEIVGDILPENRVRVYHSENQALRTTHESSLSADWANAAGILNVSVGEDLDLHNNDYYASIEQILLWNPEVIIANETAAVNLITGSPQWSGIQAVQDGKVFKLPQGISRWGHPGSIETPLALLWSAKTVYPEQFANIDIKKEVAYYYKTFFNMDLEEEMIETIIGGKDLREPK